MMNLFASNTRKLTVACAVLGLALGALGCSSSDSDDDGSGGSGATSGSNGSGATGGTSSSGGTSGSNSSGGAGGGSTTCGLSNCEAGQHCDNGLCIDGCLTDNNCAENQHCEDIDDFTHTGTCRNVTTPATKDCKTFCDKAAACMESIESCDQICAALSSECVTCVNDSNCGSGCEDVCQI